MVRVRLAAFIAVTIALAACGESRRHPHKGKGQNADADGKTTTIDGELPDTGTFHDDAPTLEPDDDNAPPPADAAPTREACHLDAAAPELETFADVLALINALPMPVTLPCFLDVLPRPLRIVATSSGLSIQPALDEKNPRIFALSGQLVLAIVPNGPNAALLELSQILSSTRSIKGEIAFPVTATLAAEAPYEHTAKFDGSAGSRCEFCHGSETLNADGHYESRALRPVTSSVIPYTRMLDLVGDCAGVDSSRCEIMKSLFDDAVEGAFPTDMPTMF